MWEHAPTLHVQENVMRWLLLSKHCTSRDRMRLYESLSKDPLAPAAQCQADLGATRKDASLSTSILNTS